MIDKLQKLTSQDRERILSQSLAHFRNPTGNNLIERTKRFNDYISTRAEFGLWPFGRTFEGPMGPRMQIAGINSDRGRGLNFSSTDYLGLSVHPQVVDAGIRAAGTIGPHSAGSGILTGNSALTRELEAAVGDLMNMEYVLLYPTGWAAGFGIIGAFVRPRDHIVIDYLAHASLQQGAVAATPQVHHFAHNSAEDLEAKLSAIRAKDARNGILVVTEGLFSMDSDTPNLGRLQEISSTYDATLLVDIAHDVGSMGPGGGSMLAEQGQLGKVDLVMGSFSKTFGTNGGFLATRSAAAKQFARCFGNSHMFSTFMAPMQAALALEAMRISRSSEGDDLRARLLRNSRCLRDGLAEHGLHCIGIPSGIVAVPFNNDRVCRLATRRLSEQNVFANLVEYPAVPVGGARFRLVLMATHTEDDMRETIAAILAAKARAETDLELWQRT